MDKVVGQMKTNKEQVYKPVQQLKQRIDQLIKEITVRFYSFRKRKTKRRFSFRSEHVDQCDTNRFNVQRTRFIDRSRI